MLKLRLILVFCVLVVCKGCTKKEPANQPPRAAPSLPSSPTANVPPRLDASLTQAPAPPSPLQPLAEGKRVRITKLEVDPLEITVPPDFRLRMQGGEESAPVAYLEGPEFKVSVDEPEGGSLSLKTARETFARSYPTSSNIVTAETMDGYLLVDWLTFGGRLQYVTYLSLPKLRVQCDAHELETMEQANLAASICLSLRASPGKARRR